MNSRCSLLFPLLLLLTLLSSVAACQATRPECAAADPFCNPAATALLLAPAPENREIDWIYWADSANQQIQRIRPDGSELTNVTGTTNINIFFLDPGSSRLYWTEGATSRLVRANLDGSDVRHKSLTGTPVGLAVDGDRGFVYIANSGTDQIERYDLDGNNLTVLASGLSQPRDLDLDPIANILYWTDDTDQVLYSMSAAGGAISTVFSGLNTGAATRYEITERRIYLTEASGSNRFMRIDPARPADFETLHSGSIWVGLADPERNRLFMADPVGNVVYQTDWLGNIQSTFVDVTASGGMPTSPHFLYK